MLNGTKNIIQQFVNSCVIVIYIIFLIKHKIQQRINKENTIHKLKNYVTVLKVLKNPKNLKNTRADV